MNQQQTSRVVRGPAPWRLVLPVKDASVAKSRLQVRPGVDRVELARAMALDTVAAVLASPAVGVVLVVTSDPVVSAAVLAMGGRVEADPGAGLNAAIRHGRDLLLADGPGPVAVLLADLPALEPADLTAALAAVADRGTSYVPDAERTGTVLLAAADGRDLQPSFGPGSAARHEAVAARLDLDRPRLRRDVDVDAALQEAVTLGVGPRTRAALAGQPTGQPAGQPAGQPTRSG